MVKRKWSVIFVREQVTEVVIDAEDDEEAERLAFKMLDDNKIKESAWCSGEEDVDSVEELDGG